MSQLSILGGHHVELRDSARLAIHSAPGWSVIPWTTIEISTARAAMPKIRSASVAADESTKSEKVMVATPLGPNQAMNALPSGPTWRVPASAANTATGRATTSVKTAIATAAQP